MTRGPHRDLYLKALKHYDEGVKAAFREDWSRAYKWTFSAWLLASESLDQWPPHSDADRDAKPIVGNAKARFAVLAEGYCEKARGAA